MVLKKAWKWLFIAYSWLLKQVVANSVVLEELVFKIVFVSMLVANLVVKREKQCCLVDHLGNRIKLGDQIEKSET